MKKSSLPNIFFITADTLRFDYLGCYGNRGIKTPHIDQLAQEGVLFRQCISQGQNTNPSLASILTSVYPKDHGIYNNSTRLSAKWMTLPEILRENGYTTAAFVSAYHLNPRRSGFGKGFDKFFTCRRINRKAEETNRLVFKWLEHHRKEPFFIWIHYFDPHLPYLPPEPFNEMYYTGDPRDPSHHSMEEMVIPEGASGYYIDWLKGITDIEYPRSQYKGEVSYLDAQFGELIQGLKAMDLYEEGLISFTSDHGESLGEHGVYFDHAGLYDAIVHVPLIMRYQPLGGSVEIKAMVESIDIFPTITETLNLSTPEEIRGRSLLPLIQEPDRQLKEAAFSEHNRHLAVSLRTEKFKYIYSLKDDHVYPRHPFKAKEQKLFNLSSDPEEVNNLVEQLPEVASQFEAITTAWLEKGFEGKPPDKSIKGTFLKKCLRALGYVE